jgi:hypothetical protein
MIVPNRDSHRTPRETGQQIAALVPPERTLYLFRLKDEGILFYYGRTVRRLPAPSCLPASEHAAYCLLIESERQQEIGSRQVEMLLPLRDEQGHPFVLARLIETISDASEKHRQPLPSCHFLSASGLPSANLAVDPSLLP